MNHLEALAPRAEPDRRDPNPQCQGELRLTGGGFWWDVNWSVYLCPGCGCRIAAREGRPHWWNHILTVPKTASGSIK